MDDFKWGMSVFLKLIPLAILMVLTVNAVKKTIQGVKEGRYRGKESLFHTFLAIGLSLLTSIGFSIISGKYNDRSDLIRICIVFADALYIWALGVNFYELFLKVMYEFVDSLLKNVLRNFGQNNNSNKDDTK